MLELTIKTLEDSEELKVRGETKQEILIKLATKADFFVTGQTYRRIRFDHVNDEDK